MTSPEKLRAERFARPEIPTEFPQSAAVEPEPPSDEVRRLGVVVPRNVRLGTRSWSFPGWSGKVWSRFSTLENLANDGLPAYGHYPLFRTVELDRTYYRPLSVGQYWKFSDQVPEDFRFMVKAPASVTDSMLRDRNGRPKGENPFFLDASRAETEFLTPLFEGLREKAGPVILRITLDEAKFRTPEKRQETVERIGEFLRALPEPPDTSPECFYAAEIRVPQLYTPRYVQMLRESGARLVIGLHPAMPDVFRQTNALQVMDGAGKPEEGDIRLAGPLVIRWNLSNAGFYEGQIPQFGPYAAMQSPDPLTREGIVKLLEAACACGQPAYVAVSNMAEGCAPDSVRAIASRLADKLKEQRDEAEKRRFFPQRTASEK